VRETSPERGGRQRQGENGHVRTEDLPQEGPSRIESREYMKRVNTGIERVNP